MCASCPIQGSCDASSRIHVVILIMLSLTRIHRFSYCITCGLRSINVNSLGAWSFGGIMIVLRISRWLRRIARRSKLKAINLLVQTIKSFVGEVDSNYQCFSPVWHFLKQSKSSVRRSRSLEVVPVHEAYLADSWVQGELRDRDCGTNSGTA